MFSHTPAGSLLELVGQTPLLRASPHLFFKLEYLTPFRSIADRIVRVLIRTGAIDGPLRISVVDPLSVSAIGLTRVQGYLHSRPAVLEGDPEFMGAGAEAVRQLLGPCVAPGDHEALLDRIARHGRSALAATWAEVATEIRADLPPDAAFPELVVPGLPWVGLGTMHDQLEVAREALGDGVVLACERESGADASDGMVTVPRAEAVAAARRLGCELGLTPYLLGGAVAHCCLERAAAGRSTAGILGDSAEWHDFALDEAASEADE